MPRREDDITARLLRSRPVQISLGSLLIVTAVAPLLIWAAYLVCSPLAKRVTEFRSRRPAAARPVGARNMRRFNRGIQSETPLVMQIALPVTAFALATGAMTFCGVRLLYRTHRHVVTLLIVCSCGTCVIIAAALWLAVGAGNTSVLGAARQDYFVVALTPLAVSAAVGAVLANAAFEH